MKETLQFGNPAPKNRSLGSLFFSNLLFNRSSIKKSQTQTDKSVYKIRNANLRVNNLNVYIQKNHILKNVNIEILDKKITCIIGPSGCGKSTLLKTFNRLIDDTEGVKYDGSILVDGTDIFNKRTEITEIRKKMGLLSQRPCPLPMSIYDNIAFGCKMHGEHKKKKLNQIVEEQLKAVGLWEEVKNRLNSPAS